MKKSIRLISLVLLLLVSGNLHAMDFGLGLQAGSFTGGVLDGFFGVGGGFSFGPNVGFGSIDRPTRSALLNVTVGVQPFDKFDGAWIHRRYEMIRLSANKLWQFNRPMGNLFGLFFALGPELGLDLLSYFPAGPGVSDQLLGGSAALRTGFGARMIPTNNFEILAQFSPAAGIGVLYDVGGFFDASFNIVGRYWLGRGRSEQRPRRDPRPAVPRRAANLHPEGIYLGIVTFADLTFDITEGPIMLTHAGINQITNALRRPGNRGYNREETQLGSALYHGVHRAMSNMTEWGSRAPANLVSAHIITIATGNDNQSGTLSLISQLEGRSFDNEGYADFIAREFRDRVIGDRRSNIRVTGHALGVPTPLIPLDTLTSDMVRLDSRGLDPDHDLILPPGMSPEERRRWLSDRFYEIVDDIVSSSSTTSYFMRTPLFGGIGSRVRMTFDIDIGRVMGDLTPEILTAIGNSSSRWIEGSIAQGRTRTDFYLDNIRYSNGLTSTISPGGRVRAQLVGANLVIEFPDLRYHGVPFAHKLDVPANYRLQWFVNPGEDVETSLRWNPQYIADPDTETQVRMDSSIIYLVLDRSISLSDGQVDDIRQAALTFVETLWEAVPEAVRR